MFSQEIYARIDVFLFFLHRNRSLYFRRECTYVYVRIYFILFWKFRMNVYVREMFFKKETQHTTPRQSWPYARIALSQISVFWGGGKCSEVHIHVHFICFYNRAPLKCSHVRIHMLWCVAVCCSVLQCVAVCCSVLQCVAVCCSVLQRVAVWCSVVQCGAMCCSVMQCVAVCSSVLLHAAVCCIALQCAVVCCSVLQFAAACCSVL